MLQSGKLHSYGVYRGRDRNEGRLSPPCPPKQMRSWLLLSRFGQWPRGEALASSVMTHLKVVVRVDVNIMKTSQGILKNDVKCWLLSGIKCGRTRVLTGQMRVLGFRNVFNQYYKICWPN